MIDQLRAAAEALNQGDPEPFASLIGDANEWRGVSHGQLWWKRTPACHGADEAREVLKFQIEKRGDRLIEIKPEFTQVGDDKIIGSTQWLDAFAQRDDLTIQLAGTDDKRMARAGSIYIRVNDADQLAETLRAAGAGATGPADCKEATPPDSIIAVIEPASDERSRAE